jgi:hypothetical protein
MSTASSAANPAPATITIVPGGPLSADSTMPGRTVNASRLAAVPPWPVMLTGPVEAPAGTVAVISAEDRTLNSPATPPNLTPATPVNPEPLIVTSVPIVPETGLNELTARAATAPGTATPSQARTRATPTSHQARHQHQRE